MGFRKRESNQEGFGIQRNEKMKAGGSMPKKPRKKAKKKPVVKQQGMKKRKMKKNIREDLFAGLQSGKYKLDNLTPEQLAFVFNNRRAAKILEAAAGAQDIVMTNQQDQGQIATGGDAVATGGDANASAEASPNINVTAKPVTVVDTSMGVNVPIDIQGLQRGAVTDTPEGQMIVDPLTGVLMPFPITTPGFEILPPGDGVMQGPRTENGFYDEYGQPQIINDRIIEMLPDGTSVAVDPITGERIPIQRRGEGGIMYQGLVMDKRTGFMLDNTRGIAMDPNTGRMMHFDPSVGFTQGMFADGGKKGMVVPSLEADDSRRVTTEEGEFIVSSDGKFIPIKNRGRVGTRPQGSLGDGGMKYQGSIFTEITKGDEEKMKAGGTKKKRRVMNKKKSNRYGY